MSVEFAISGIDREPCYSRITLLRDLHSCYTWWWWQWWQWWSLKIKKCPESGFLLSHSSWWEEHEKKNESSFPWWRRWWEFLGRPEDHFPCYPTYSGTNQTSVPVNTWSGSRMMMTMWHIWLEVLGLSASWLLVGWRSFAAATKSSDPDLFQRYCHPDFCDKQVVHIAQAGIAHSSGLIDIEKYWQVSGSSISAFYLVKTWNWPTCIWRA